MKEIMIELLTNRALRNLFTLRVVSHLSGDA